MDKLIGAYIDDRFQVTGQIGEGGMGVVYSAIDLHSGNEVALKVMRKTAADPNARERFLREIETLAKLRCRNIIDVFAFGRDMSRGLLYAAMEFADGDDLLSLIKLGRLPAPLALQVMEDTARALLHIHEAGAFHRDIKPSNIKLVPTGDRVICKLLDFGLVKVNQKGGIDLTHQGQAPGTITYMCPEEINEQPTDNRIDLYKLGIVSYEMLTGRKPFLGTTKLATVRLILDGQTFPLSSIPDIPLPIAQFVEKLMNPDPNLRHQNAREALLALRDISEDLNLPTYKCQHVGKSADIFSDFKLLSHQL